MSTKYASARPILLGQSTVPSPKVTYHLLREMFPSEKSITLPMTETSALVARSYKGKDTKQPSGKGGGKGSGGPPNSASKNVQCYYCKEWGHMKWDCSKRPKGSPLPPRAQVATIAQSQNITALEERTDSEKLAFIMQELKELRTSHASTSKATLAHSAYKDKCLYRMEGSPQRMAYLTTVSAKEVHCQLGHPSLPVLKKIRPEF
ncbi:hypothetical protein AKJ16_DCAP00669 [Drosera capensis]